MAISVQDLEGYWDMNHDDWQGVLQLEGTGISSSAITDGPNGSCTYYSSLLRGTWTGSSGHAQPVIAFHLGGADRNRQRNESCPASGHRVQFQIEFDPRDPQRFEGYVFTNSKAAMAGYTWWSGIPFGWFATKRD